MTTFRGDVSCYTVTGEMNGGGHMWNIVTLAGKSYLVDVTNSDSGTAGQDGQFFLAGTAGSVTSGYTIGTTTFVYDTETTGIWGTGTDSILSLAGEPYTPGDEEPEEDPCANGHVGETEVRGAAAATCTAEGYTGDAYCLTCGNMTTSGMTIPKTAHSYTAVVTAPTCSKEGYTTYTCSCGDTYTGDKTSVVDHAYVDGKCKWCQAEEPVVPAEPIEALKINSAALTLTEDINVLYRTTVPAIYSDPYMVFTMNGEEYKVTEYFKDENDRLCFYFRGVMPQYMNDNISATLYADYNGKEYSNTVPSYSVRKYCENQLNKTTSATLKTLLSDLLVYGEKTQLYRNYKTDNLVTAGLNLTPSAFPGLDSSYNKQTLTGTASADVRWSSAGLVLSNNMSMRIGLTTNNPEKYTYEVTINGRTIKYTAADLEANGTGKYYLYFRGIMASEFNMPVTAVIKENGVQVSQVLTYSVNTYIYKKQDMNDALGVLLKAIYNYGNSAANY